jgi:hypothetical protein
MSHPRLLTTSPSLRLMIELSMRFTARALLTVAEITDRLALADRPRDVTPRF